MPSHRSSALARIRGTRPSRRLLLVLAVLLLLSGSAALLTGATFTATTPGQVTVGAADDYSIPTAEVLVPAVASGTVEVTVDAQDARTFVTRVVVEKRAAGSNTWTTLCATTSAPWTCDWDTTGEPEGEMALRATATDSVGLTGTSPVVTTRVANSPAVTFDPIPDAVRASFTTTATVTGAAGRTVSSRFAYRLAGSTGAWTTVRGCAAVAGTTPTCTADTGTFTGDLEIRVVSTFADREVVQDSAVVQVDNTPPTARLTLSSPLSGTVVMAPTVADADSGVATVAIDYRLGTGPWVTLCTREVSPYSCSLDTTTLVEDGSYEVRATVRDVAGNSATASARAVVENATPTVSLITPQSGDLLWGVRAVEVMATAPSIGSVTVQQRLRGASDWADICVDTSAPYGCGWDTTALTLGTYELRAVLAHGDRQTLSSVIVEVIVGDPPLSAVDVQGTTLDTNGLLDQGDTFTFTYSTVVDLDTIAAGLSDGPVDVDATLVGLSPKGGKPAGAVLELPGLGQLSFTQTIADHSQQTRNIPVTLTARIVNENGKLPYTVVTATMGAVPDKWLQTDASPGTLTWTPTGDEKTPDGRASDPVVATESGAADGDL